MTPTYGDTATRVLLAVLTQPRPTVRSVAAEVGRAVGHTHALLVELRDAGLVTWERGRRGTLRPACRVVAVERLTCENAPARSPESAHAFDRLAPETSGPGAASTAPVPADTGKGCRLAER